MPATDSDLATAQQKLTKAIADKQAADAATAAGNNAVTALATAQANVTTATAAVSDANTAEAAADSLVDADLADLESFLAGLSAPAQAPAV